MNSILRFALFIGLLLAGLVLLPFLFDRGIAWYDAGHNAYTRPQSIRMEAETLCEGQNRRLFQDMRFPTTGLSFQVVASGLTAAERKSFLSDTPVRGVVSMFALPSATNAVPGIGPAPGARPILSYGFRLEPRDDDAFSEESTDVFFDKGNATRTLDFVLCPAEAEDAAAAATLEAYRFEPNVAYEFDFRVDGRLPAVNKLLFLYRRPVRRLFSRR